MRSISTSFGDSTIFTSHVVAIRKLARLVTGSLRAVSEAPTSEEVGSRDAVEGRFRYSDLKEAAPGGLWDLFLDEAVAVVCGVDLAVGAFPFQLLVAERMVVGRYIGESGVHHQTAF